MAGLWNWFSLRFGILEGTLIQIHLQDKSQLTASGILNHGWVSLTCMICSLKIAEIKCLEMYLNHNDFIEISLISKSCTGF